VGETYFIWPFLFSEVLHLPALLTRHVAGIAEFDHESSGGRFNAPFHHKHNIPVQDDVQVVEEENRNANKVSASG
jgi:hypothetical protein